MPVVRASIRPKFDSSRDPRLLSRHALSDQAGLLEDLFAGKLDGVAVELFGQLQVSQDDSVHVDVFKESKSTGQVEVLRRKPVPDQGGVFFVSVIVNDIGI